MPNQYTDAPQASREEIDKRRILVLKLRRTGWSWEDIATEVSRVMNKSVSDVTCYQDYKTISALRNKEMANEVDAIRNDQIYRLNMAIRRIWEKIDRDGPDYDALEILIKLENRIARLMGTDAAVKSQVEVSKRPELSQAEIKSRIADALERIKAKAELPAPSVTVTAIPVPEIVEGVVIERNDEALRKDPSTQE